MRHGFDINFKQEKIIIDNLPVLRGIYFLFENDEIVYIGQSLDIHKRVRNHKVDKSFDSYNFIESDEINLGNIEAEYIIKLRPKYNASIPPNDLWLSQNLIKKKFGVGKLETNKMIRNGEVEFDVFYGTAYIKGFKR